MRARGDRAARIGALILTQATTRSDASEALPYGAPGSPEEAAVKRAEVTARREVHVLCGDAYDAVVLPAVLLEKEGWLVYLLPRFAKPGMRALAGYQLVRVSADGTTVLEQASLAEKCVVANESLRPGDVVRLPRSIGDAPTEDYYTSMAYGVRLELVFDDGRVWRVEPPR
jgi:hypothetical protein